MSSSHDQPTSGWANEPIHQDPAPIVTSGQGIGTTVTLPEPLTSPPLYQELAVPAVIPTVQQTHPTRTYCNETWKVSCKRNALVQGVSGFLCIALGFISVGMECVYSDTGIAIWSGVWVRLNTFLLNYEASRPCSNYVSVVETIALLRRRSKVSSQNSICCSKITYKLLLYKVIYTITSVHPLLLHKTATIAQRPLCIHLFTMI